MAFSPKLNAAAYVIWVDAQAHGWDRTIAEIAESVDMSVARVSRVIGLRGWRGRVRSAQRYDGLERTVAGTDDDMTTLAAGHVPDDLLAEQ
ncbi:hypothetical protein [Paracoccus sp. (in: a-proteobacteria)]|uniref:hypothetical protein n=1 Tax=Paracoccus sp. TaxID=267 RepID=UPI003A8820BB